MAEYYLPQGRWTNFLTGEVREGGQWYKEKHGYRSIPLYAKEGSIVAVGATNESAVYDYADGVTFRAFELPDGVTEQIVYDGDGKADTIITITKSGNEYKIFAQGTKPCYVEIAGEKEPADISGGSIEKDGDIVKIAPVLGKELVLVY